MERRNLRMKQDKEWEGPLLSSENVRVGSEDVVITDTFAWESPNYTIWRLIAPEACIVVGEWVATLWDDVELQNTVDRVTRWPASQYIARVDNWGFSVMEVNVDESFTLQLTNDGVKIDGCTQGKTQLEVSTVEDVVRGQDIPAYFPGMLCDLDRNAQFREAIGKCIEVFKRNVGRSPRVVDIGAGTGLLTHYALEAGAQCVTAIEGNAVRAGIVRDRFTRDERVEVFQGFSTDFLKGEEDFEPFDMVVTETLGTWAHFEKGHDYIKDFIQRRVVHSTDYIIPQRIKQFISFRSRGEFERLKRSRRKRVFHSARFELKEDPETRVHELWRKLMPQIGQRVNLFEHMRLLHTYLNPCPQGPLMVTYPQGLAPHELDANEEWSLPEKYRLFSELYTLQRDH